LVITPLSQDQGHRSRRLSGVADINFPFACPAPSLRPQAGTTFGKTKVHGDCPTSRSLSSLGHTSTIINHQFGLLRTWSRTSPQGKLLFETMISCREQLPIAMRSSLAPDHYRVSATACRARRSSSLRNLVTLKPAGGLLSLIAHRGPYYRFSGREDLQKYS